jgi:hypothetical protein
MLVCTAIWNSVRVLVRRLIQLIKEVVKTVCELVTTVIRTVKEVCEEVCGWLGPFSFLCDWVCKVIEVVETVTEWVCKEVIERIITWIEVLVEYVLWFVSWICWVVDWIFRFFELLLCWAGVKHKEYIHICVKVLTDENGRGGLTREQINNLLAETQVRFDQCNIEICSQSIEFVEKPELMNGYGKSIFSEHFLWFNQNECSRLFSLIIPVTVYVVESISNDAKGRAFLNTNFIVIAPSASIATIAHEIGHLCALGHTEEPTNVMMNGTTDASVNFTKNQCCVIRSSRFVGLICDKRRGDKGRVLSWGGRRD